MIASLECQYFGESRHQPSTAFGVSGLVEITHPLELIRCVYGNSIYGIQARAGKSQ
jgi:hypothetical protein